MRSMELHLRAPYKALLQQRWPPVADTLHMNGAIGALSSWSGVRAGSAAMSCAGHANANKPDSARGHTETRIYHAHA